MSYEQLESSRMLTNQDMDQDRRCLAYWSAGPPSDAP
ncbi:hypothetical protein QF026_008354 [Streptomyces aurantiacus]|nr:hypothetical protein [Streptomyces aurantiacus]